MAVNKDGVPEVLRKVIMIDSGDGPGLVKSGKCRQDAGIRGNTVNPGRGRRDSENSGPVIQQVEARDAAKYPAMHRTEHPHKKIKTIAGKPRVNSLGFSRGCGFNS